MGRRESGRYGGHGDVQRLTCGARSPAGTEPSSEAGQCTPPTTAAVGLLHALGHVHVAVIDLVDLLHALERFLLLAHALKDEAELVEDFLFRGVHGDDLAGASWNCFTARSSMFFSV